MTPVTLDSQKIALHQDNVGDALSAVFASFDKEYEAAPHRVMFGIAGVAFDCRSRDGAYLESAARSVIAATGAEEKLQRIFVNSSGPSRFFPWPVWSERTFNEREVEAALQGGHYRLHYFGELDFWQAYDRESGCGLQLMRANDELPPWDPGAPLRNLLHWGLLEEDLALLHAGTLASGANGVLLVGAGGSGKSGTVAAGILHGLGTVGDDYVAVHVGDEARAYPVFTTLKQDMEGLVRVGAKKNIPAASAPNWQGKHLVEIAALARVPQPREIDIRALVLPKVADVPVTTFKTASAREAFLALAPSGITQIPSARSEMFALCARLARQLPAWRVDLGTDPIEVAEAFATFCEAAQ